MDAKLDFTLGLSLGVLHKGLSARDLKGTSSRHEDLILDGILDGSESISDGLLGLSDGVIIGTLDQDSAGERILNTLDEGILVVTKDLLVDVSGKTEIVLGEVINGVDLSTTTGKRDSLTVSLLAPSDSNDAIVGEELERWGVNTLLVDDNKVLAVLRSTELSLELNDFHDLIVGELSLGGDELLSLLSVGPEEAGVDLSLLVLKGDVEAKDVAVLEIGWEVRVSSTVIKNKTANQLGLGGHLVLHVHDFNHVEVEGLILLLDGVDGINKDVTERVAKVRVDLGVQRSLGNLDQSLLVHLDFLFAGLKVLEGLVLGELDTINKDSGVDTVTNVALSLSHELTNEKDVGSGTITNHVVLSSGRTTNHCGSRVLNLHFVEKYSAILGQFNLTGTTDKHLDGTLGTEVGLQNLLETLGGVDVDAKSLGFTDDIRVGIHKLER